MAGDDEDYGSARITLDLDESGAVRDAGNLGTDLERALSRATRNIGRVIRDNIVRGLRRAALPVQVEPDLSQFRQSLRDGARALSAVAVPVTADLQQLRQDLVREGSADSITAQIVPDRRRLLGGLRDALRGFEAEIQVRADAARLVREIETELGRIDPPEITLAVRADLSRAESQLRSVNAPEIRAQVTADVDAVRQQLQDLVDQGLDIPITIGDGGGARTAGAAAGSAALSGLMPAFLAGGPWGAIIAGVASYAALVGTALTTGIAGVIEHGQLTGALQASLGLSSAEAHQAGRVVGELYARGVVDSVEEGAQAVQGALRAGLAAPDDLPGLERISSAVADLGRLMDEDVGQVARAVGQMVRTGLVDNAMQGIDLLTRSVQQGGNAAEDLLDTFSEYSTQFRQLGLSAQDVFGLIQQGLRNGARDSDVIADTLKEFSIEAAQGGERVVEAFKAMELDANRLTESFAKGGPEARKALDEVFDALHEIEDPLERNQAAVGLFGTKAEDMADALSSLDLDTAAKEMDGFGGATARAGDALRDNLGSHLQRIGREAKQAFQGLFTGDFSQFADVGEAIQDALPDLKETGKHIAESIEQGITQHGPRIVEALFRVGQEIGERVDLWGPLLLKLTAGVVALPAVMGALLLTALGGVLKGIGVKLLPYAEQAWEAVANFFTDTIPRFASDVGSALADGFQSAFESATGAVSSWIGTVVGYVTGLPGRIASGASALISAVGDMFSQAFQAGTQAVSAGIDAIGNFFLQLPGRIWEALLALPGLLVEAFTSAIAYAIIGVLTAIAGLVFIFTELPQRIWATLQSLGTFLLSAFILAVQQVRAWLGTAFTAVVEFFRTLPGRISAALSALGSFLLRNFVSAFNAVRSRLTSWMNSTVEFFRTLPGRIAAALSALGSFLLRNFVSAFNAVRSRLTSWMNSTVEFFRALPGRIAGALSSLPGKLASAFNSAAGRARSAVSSLISGVVALFQQLPGKILSAIGDIGSQIMSKVRSGIPDSVRQYLPFAKGGIVYGPTHALIGEAGPEVVIPLTKPQRARQLAAQSGLLDILGNSKGGQGGGAVVNNYWTINEVGDGRATAQRVINRLVLGAGMVV